MHYTHCTLHFNVSVYSDSTQYTVHRCHKYQYFTVTCNNTELYSSNNQRLYLPGYNTSNQCEGPIIGHVYKGVLLKSTREIR